MNAYVAVTDAEWFEFLARQEDVDEVNFWQPKPWGGELGVLQRGEPLLFKLKAPHNAIAGVGFFERYVTLPFSLAWDAFGVKNGDAEASPEDRVVSPTAPSSPATAFWAEPDADLRADTQRLALADRWAPAHAVLTSFARRQACALCSVHH